MSKRIFLIHWNSPEAEIFANELRSDGWEVDIESEDGHRAYESIKANPPNAVVIYLSRLAAHGRETADALLSAKATRDVPIIFVDGSEDALEKTKVKIPGAAFVTSAELKKFLQKLPTTKFREAKQRKLN